MTLNELIRALSIGPHPVQFKRYRISRFDLAGNPEIDQRPDGKFLPKEKGYRLPPEFALLDYGYRKQIAEMLETMTRHGRYIQGVGLCTAAVDGETVDISYITSDGIKGKLEPQERGMFPGGIDEGDRFILIQYVLRGREDLEFEMIKLPE